MLNGGDAEVIASKDGASLGVHHILGNGIDNGHAFKVNTLDLVSVILWSRIESHRKA
jgi:hypothetical protein